MVNIKMCGMTNLDDCLAAVDLGVEFIGFVFYEKSKRYVAPDRVRHITESLDGAIRTVGVFVGLTEQRVHEMMAFCSLDFAQVYSPTPVSPKISVHRVKDALPEVAPYGLVLFDSYAEGFGGSGVCFDFSLLEGHHALSRAFVAGGINEGNVGRVLGLKPYGIDLVSSVERYPGRKDVRKMKNFVNKVRSIEL